MPRSSCFSRMLKTGTRCSERDILPLWNTDRPRRLAYMVRTGCLLQALLRGKLSGTIHLKKIRFIVGYLFSAFQRTAQIILSCPNCTNWTATRRKRKPLSIGQVFRPGQIIPDISRLWVPFMTISSFAFTSRNLIPSGKNRGE